VADARQVPFEHPKDYDPVTGDTSWSSGACSMTQRTAFERIGGFDHETFFMYCDDVDYSWRLRLRGYRAVYAPSAALFHDKRLSLEGDMQAGASELYYSAEAALMLAHKYSRPDIVNRLTKSFHNGDENAKRALTEYESRRGAGTLPTPLDGDHRVGQFTRGNYAVHRF
jgi:GT2 family glycosyltransferase